MEDIRRRRGGGFRATFGSDLTFLGKVADRFTNPTLTMVGL